jgi:DNA-directed RNA polymerase subunit RPC12/RpoP
VSNENDTDPEVVRCDLCGYRYRLDRAERGCDGCPLSGSCELVKCPNCGYETPRDEMTGED